MDGSKGDHRAPEYLAINPNGKVPALVDGGQAYFESLAILLHLAQSYGSARELWPSQGARHAQALSWTVWGTAELRVHTLQYLYHGLDTPVSYAPKDRSQAAADYSHRQYQRLLDVLDTRLSGRDFLLGGFSLADVSPASALFFGVALGASVEGRANVEAWLERCRARPARTRAGDWFSQVPRWDSRVPQRAGTGRRGAGGDDERGREEGHSDVDLGIAKRRRLQCGGAMSSTRPDTSEQPGVSETAVIKIASKRTMRIRLAGVTPIASDAISRVRSATLMSMMFETLIMPAHIRDADEPDKSVDPAENSHHLREFLEVVLGCGVP